MTFEEWIKNPAGGKSAVMTHRDMYKDLYTSKFDKLLLREGNKFNYVCYKNKLGTEFVIHIKVPSEVVPNFYYDVVVAFSTKNPALITDTNLNKYDVQFYTNSPDFVYTHCHAYVKAKLFFKPLEKRMNKLSLTKVAVERNPKDDVGYVKSIFFAYLIMKYHKLFAKVEYNNTYSDGLIVDTVRDADSVVAARQEAEAKMKADVRRERIKAKHKANEEARAQHGTNTSSMSKATKFVSRTPKVTSKFSKTTKRTGSTKRI